MNVIQSYSLPISSKGQVTIPVFIRRLLGLDKTGRLSVEVLENEAVVIKSPKMSLKDVYGAVKPINKSFKQMRQIVKDERLK